MTVPTIYDYGHPVKTDIILGDYIELLGIQVNNKRLLLFMHRLVAGPDNCIICTYAPRMRDGDKEWYPAVGFTANKRINAHRFAYALWVDGNIPPECMVCHNCDNPRCVNPNHLYLGDAWSNRLDTIERGRANIVPRRPVYMHLLPEMRRLRKLGLSYQDIGRQLGTSWQTPRVYLLRYGLEEE